MPQPTARVRPSTVRGDLGVKTMYEVKSTDPLGDTGNKVRARAGKQCVGYSDLYRATYVECH